MKIKLHFLKILRETSTLKLKENNIISNFLVLLLMKFKKMNYSKHFMIFILTQYQKENINFNSLCKTNCY